MVVPEPIELKKVTPLRKKMTKKVLVLDMLWAPLNASPRIGPRLSTFNVNAISEVGALEESLYVESSTTVMLGEAIGEICEL